MLASPCYSDQREEFLCNFEIVYCIQNGKQLNKQPKIEHTKLFAPMVLYRLDNYLTWSSVCKSLKGLNVRNRG